MFVSACECAGKAESHPGRQVSSHSCLAIVPWKLPGHCKSWTLSGLDSWIGL